MDERQEFAFPKLFKWTFLTAHFVYFTTLKLAVVGFFAFIYLYSNYLLELPQVVSLNNYRSPTITRIYSPEGEEVSRYARENRVVVSIDEIPDHVVNAFLAAEDKRFFEHSGVDPVSISRAVLQNIGRSSNNQRLIGASTITQQVAKIFFTGDERSIDRKIKEALLAVEIDRRLSKREILELYLNRIEFGLNAHGVAAAGRAYFGKEIDELSVSDAAFLAALPKGPSQYHPLRNTERATDRRDWVVGRMLNNGFITDWDAWSAMKEALPTDIAQGHQLKPGDYFTDQVRRELITHFGEQKVFEDGLVVQTTVDQDLQTIAERALRNGLSTYDRRHGWRGALGTIDIVDPSWLDQLNKFVGPKDIPEWKVAVVLTAGQNSSKIVIKGGDTGYIPINEMTWARPWRKGQTLGPEVSATWKVVKPGDVVLVEPLARQGAQGAKLFALRQIPDVNGALVAIDPKDGHIMALTGGFSFAQSQFNRASQGKRQPGSTFKPFVYLAGLNNGFSPKSLVKDEALKVTFDSGEVWQPKNAGGTFWGPVQLTTALKFSRNLPTVRLARKVGMRRISNYARLFGIEEDMPGHLANSLGARETTLLKMTGAYAMLARDGELVIPTAIRTVKDRAGNTIFDSKTNLCIGCLTSSPVIRRNAEHLPLAKKPYTKTSVRELRGMLREVIQSGTAQSLADGMPNGVAGKTGTTNNNRDAWFVGFTDDIVIGVTVGFDTPKTLGDKEQGGRVAGPIFKKMLLNSLDAMQQRDPEFELPVIEVKEVAPVVAAVTPTTTRGTSSSAKKKSTKKKSTARSKTKSRTKSSKAKAENLFGFQVSNQPRVVQRVAPQQVYRPIQQQPVYQQPTYQQPSVQQPSSGGGSFSTGVY